MKRIRKILIACIMLVLVGAGLTTLATSCNSNRYMTYEDGMFDTNEVYQDAAEETMQINSEIDNDDRERY